MCRYIARTVDSKDNQYTSENEQMLMKQRSSPSTVEKSDSKECKSYLEYYENPSCEFRKRSKYDLIADGRIQENQRNEHK